MFPTSCSNADMRFFRSLGVMWGVWARESAKRLRPNGRLACVTCASQGRHVQFMVMGPSALSRIQGPTAGLRRTPQTRQERRILPSPGRSWRGSTTCPIRATTSRTKMDPSKESLDATGRIAVYRVCAPTDPTNSARDEFTRDLPRDAREVPWSGPWGPGGALARHFRGVRRAAATRRVTCRIGDVLP